MTVGRLRRAGLGREVSIVKQGTRPRAWVGSVLAMLFAAGCVPHVDDTRIYDERSTGDSRSAEERREPDPEVTSSVNGNSVRVSAV